MRGRQQMFSRQRNMPNMQMKQEKLGLNILQTSAKI